jgi:hypothetical protein
MEERLRRGGEGSGERSEALRLEEEATGASTVTDFPALAAGLAIGFDFGLDFGLLFGLPP